MELRERIRRYAAIEAYRKRPLIVYATSTRVNVHGMMAGDAVRELVDQIRATPEGHEVDVLIHSIGGDALAAWKLMSVLRERFANVAVLVPYMAFSAATIFALGADEIVMHPYASLGPIDPQITVTLPDQTKRRFSFEEVGAFLRFLGEEVRITEQVHVSAIMDKLFGAVDPLNVGAAKRASELATAVGERLLRMHMTGPEEGTRAREIAAGLNKNFFAHGDAVSRSQARKQQLKVAKDDPKLEELIWRAYLGLEGYMQLRKPFMPLWHFLRDKEAAATVRPLAPLVLPQNAPPQLAQKVWEGIVNQAVQNLARGAVEVPYSVVNALVESTRLASECYTRGVLTASRVAGGNILLVSTETDGGWRQMTPPEVGGSGGSVTKTAADET